MTSVASGYGVSYFRSFAIDLLLRKIMEECLNVEPCRYFSRLVGQRTGLENYVGQSLTNHNMFHFAKCRKQLALDTDQCYIFAGFLTRNQR